ncbi:MAG: Hydrolase, alpha/beta fold family, partial [uncultured Ramlibacter sp.]
VPTPQSLPQRVCPDPQAALPRAPVGRAGARQGAAGDGARLDGRGSVLAVRRRRLRAGPLRHRAGLARLRPDGVARGRQLLVPRLPGRPRLPAGPLCRRGAGA